MRGFPTRNVLVVSAVGLAVLGIAGCGQQPTSGGDQSSSDLKIVEQVQISPDGASVTPAADAAPPVSPAGDGTAICPPLSLAMAGPLTGADAPFGANVRDGAQLAIDQHNAANPGCQVQLKPFDTEGDPQKAVSVAPQIVDDPAIIGLVGPTWSGETKATGSVFDQAGLVTVTPSATNVALSEQGWKTFFRGLSSDGVQGPSLANYLKNTLAFGTACVVDDSTDAGVGQAGAVRDTLGPIAEPACNISIKKGDKDFSAAVSQITAQSPDVVVFASYYAEGALLLQQLRDSGYTGLFAGPDGLKDPQFVKAAGQAAQGCGAVLPVRPGHRCLRRGLTEAFGQAPGTYSIEGYDLTTILLNGIDSGAHTRPALLDFVRGYDGQGVARKYQWTDNGELTTNLIWIYKVQ